MPRDGANVYTQPFPDVSSGTTVASAVYNGFTHDVAQDLNTPRPIVAGGTAANNADTALFNLSAAKAAQVVTNYDTQLWIPGTFYSATTASGEPVDGQAFSGIAYIGEALTNPPANLNVTVEARSLTDGKLYIRRKIAGVWGAWALDGDFSGINAAIALKVDKAGDTMTGPLVLPAAAPTLGTHAANKTYVDAGDAAVTAAFGAANTTQDTAINNRVRHDAAQGLAAANRTQARSNISAPLKGTLWGLTLSYVSTTTFGIAAGEAADSTGVDLMVLASAYTKTTGAWAVGSGTGALDTGTISASAWYYVFLIKRPDTGVVDVLVSLSPTAPTLPANYTLFRRIGAIFTVASLWQKFVQIGDEFLWGTPSNDHAAVNPGTAGANYNLRVPTSITVKANVQCAFSNTGVAAVCYIDSTMTDVLSPSVTGGFSLSCISATTLDTGRFEIWTANSSIHAQSNNAGTNQFYATTFGWTDHRGRQA